MVVNSLKDWCIYPGQRDDECLQLYIKRKLPFFIFVLFSGFFFFVFLPGGQIIHSQAKHAYCQTCRKLVCALGRKKGGEDQQNQSLRRAVKIIIWLPAGHRLR